MDLNPLTPRAQLLGRVQQLLASHHICSVVLDASSPRTEDTRTLVIPEDVIVILCPMFQLCRRALDLVQDVPGGDGDFALRFFTFTMRLWRELDEDDEEEATGCMWRGSARFDVRGQEVTVHVIRVGPRVHHG